MRPAPFLALLASLGACAAPRPDGLSGPPAPRQAERMADSAATLDCIAIAPKPGQPAPPGPDARAAMALAEAGRFDPSLGNPRAGEDFRAVFAEAYARRISACRGMMTVAGAGASAGTGAVVSASPGRLPRGGVIPSRAAIARADRDLEETLRAENRRRYEEDQARRREDEFRRALEEARRPTAAERDRAYLEGLSRTAAEQREREERYRLERRLRRLEEEARRAGR